MALWAVCLAPLVYQNRKLEHSKIRYHIQVHGAVQWKTLHGTSFKIVEISFNNKAGAEAEEQRQ